MAKRQTLMVRAFNDEERAVIEVCAASYWYKPFAERRSRILLASSQGKPPLQIAADLGVDDETVRRAIRAFNERGAVALLEGSPKPKHTGDLFVPGGRDALMDIFRRTPKHYGFDHEEWTLELIADAAFADCITTTRVSDETIRHALMARHDIKWSHFKRLLRRERRKVPSAQRRVVPPSIDKKPTPLPYTMYPES
ncbi:MAG: helix-turn-helix domain-containing protein [Chloroflexales bacterium]